MAKKEVWLTTKDNPFDPFTQWDKWYRFDEKCNYCTCEKIANVAMTSTNLSDAEYENAVAQAIVTILNVDEMLGMGMYRPAIQGATQKWGCSRK